MPNINFLKTKDKKPDSQKADDKPSQENIAWSKPEGDKTGKKTGEKPGLFGLLKKEPKRPDTRSGSLPNVNISRKKVLQAIKKEDKQNKSGFSNQVNKSKIKDFFKKFFTRKRSADDLLHHQHIFHQEKEQRKNHKPKDEADKHQQELKAKINITQEVPQEEKHLDIEEKEPSIAPVDTKVELVVDGLEGGKKDDVLLEAEKKPAEQPEEWVNPDVLDSNLIKEKIISFFDWRKKAVVFVSSVLMPCLLLGIIYIGLNYYEQKQLAASEDLNIKILNLDEEISQKQVELAEILPFQKRLKLVSALLDDHIYWNNFFNFLEEQVIDSVYFVNFSGDTGGEYSLAAVGKEYKDIDKQVEAFQKNDVVIKAEVREGRIVTGAAGQGVRFNVELKIKPDIFNKID